MSAYRPKSAMEATVGQFMPKSAIPKDEPAPPDETFGENVEKKIGTMVRAANTAGTLGLSDRLSGALSQIPVVGKYLNTPVKDLVQGKVAPEMTYDEAVAKKKAQILQSAKDNPRLDFTTKAIVGSKLPFGNSIPSLAAQGAIQAGAESNEKDWGGILKDSGLGGLTSTVGAVVGNKIIPSMAKGVQDEVGPGIKAYLRNKAADSAVHAVGPPPAALRRMPLEQKREMGNTFLDEGLIKPFQGPAKIAAASADRLREYGPKVGQTMETADLGAESGSNAPYNWDSTIEKAQGAYDKMSLPSKDAARPFLDYIKNSAEPLESGFGTAHKLTSDLDSKINWNAQDKTTSRAQKAMVGALRGDVENQVEGELGPKVGADFIKNKRLFGAMKNATDWSKGTAAKEENAPAFNSNDYLAAMTLGGEGGGTVSDKLQKLLIGSAKSLYRTRGSSVTAPALRGLSNMDLASLLASPGVTQTEASTIRQLMADDENKSKVQSKLGEYFGGQ